MASGFSRSRNTGIPAVDEQFRLMQSQQFSGGGRTISVTFSTANTDTEVDVGFPVGNFIVGSIDASATIWKTGGDGRFTILQASAPCVASILFTR